MWRVIRVLIFVPISGGIYSFIFFVLMLAFMSSFIRPTYEYIGWDERTKKTYVVNYQKWLFGDSIYGGYAYYGYPIEEGDFGYDRTKSGVDNYFRGTIDDNDIITGDLTLFIVTPKWYKEHESYDSYLGIERDAHMSDEGVEKIVIDMPVIKVGDGKVTFNGATLKGGRAWFSTFWNSFKGQDSCNPADDVLCYDYVVPKEPEIFE
jgi:hypothetical protein